MYKIKQLLALNRKILHTQDLAAAWGMDNPNTLYTTVRRYKEKGILFPIRKGLYATVPLEKLDPFELGAAIANGYAYVSCETVLSLAGVIKQEVAAYTFVAQQFQDVELSGFKYRFRALPDQFLYNTAGIELRGGVLWATPERALADLRYFSPRYFIDSMNVLNARRVREMQREVGYL